MPDVDGMQVLENAILKTPKTICIILTGHGTIKSPVEAIKKGAFDYRITSYNVCYTKLLRLNGFNRTFNGPVAGENDADGFGCF